MFVFDSIFNTYHPTKIHAVKKVENTSNIISVNQQTLTFNEQNRAKEIFEGMYKAEFEYSANAHRQSMKMMVTEDPTAANTAYNISYTRYYVGEYEKEVRGNNTTEVCYINTPIGLAAAHVTQNNTSELYYLHTDHLGSIIGVSNSNQQKIYEVSYDAWGKKRPVQFWFANSELQTPPTWLWRGYTGHEHLEEFELINMNARLYDPILGRMLSPDNYNNDLTSSIAYNRYTYAFNNPLKYTDPDGNWAVYDDAIAIGLGAGFGAYMGYKIGTAKGADWGDGLLWYTLGGATIGGAAGWAALYTGGATAKAFAAGSNAILVGATVGAVSGATAGLITGVGYSAMQGNSAGQIARDGVKGMFIGAATGAITGALSGYLSTTKGGMKFGKWRASHSKGRYLDSKNPLGLTYKKRYEYTKLIDHKQQSRSLDCVEFCLESIDEYYGGTYNPSQGTNGVNNDNQFYNNVHSKDLKISQVSSKNYGHTNHEIGEIVKTNHGLNRTTMVFSDNHSMNVKAVDYYPNWGKNGRYVITYNNPDPIAPSNYFNSSEIINIFSVWR